MARLQVELLVCPDPGCRHIGRNPSWQSTKGFCVGSVKEGTAHKKARMVPAPSLIEIQHEARERAIAFLDEASGSDDARKAADWSLAAKNAISVALTCEQIVKTRNARS